MLDSEPEIIDLPVDDPVVVSDPVSKSKSVLVSSQ